MQQSWERWESRPAGKMISADLHAVGRRRPRVYGLRTFADPGCPCAEIEGHSLRGTTTWCTLLVDEKTGAVIPFYVVEEHVSLSSHPLCDHCRCAGWSHHFVSRRRYHLIIPSDDDWDRTSLRPDAFEQQTHILHGLVHCNGFGHLLRLNGRDGGSHFVAGRDVMDLWDRLCTALRVRNQKFGGKINIFGVQGNNGGGFITMEIDGPQAAPGGGPRHHLVRPVGLYAANRQLRDGAEGLPEIGGPPWSLNLDRLMEEFQRIGREGDRLHRIVLGYRRIAKARPCGPQRLQSVSDLLRFLLDFRSRRTAAAAAASAAAGEESQELVAAIGEPPHVSLPSGGRQREGSGIPSEAPAEPGFRHCGGGPRQPVAGEETEGGGAGHRRRLGAASGGMTRQEVRDAARLTIGDTGLLDFVLKSIGDCVVGGRVVRRSHNPATRVLEFSLEDLPSERGEADPSPAPIEPPPEQFSRHLVERDIAWVYRHVLLGIRPEAAEMALHCKRWGKSWDLRDEEDDRLRPPHEAPPPPEVLVLPPHATVGDLREEAEKAMRDTYCIMETFRATAVVGVAGEDGDPLFGCGAESGARVWSWKVRCVCGARDDDGERMVACDICEVWQHTRCAGIAEGAAVPPLFLCAACGTTVLRHTTTTATKVG
ncbi:unnamed protein product [Spirodela intermedia]|uniref:Zinc finger PHD-type domain-containing protein n=1 Tax=Spirodela intermedia TaxID=51605 RepID=A0A7I8J229_SPIIN|nr:unnamed protein product [Spirodela intermedia]CAA6664276.1 unnamed protein product [Spirodela intermedia]